MEKTLYLISFTLSEKGYMSERPAETFEMSRIVMATSPESAREAIENHKDFRTDEYSIYRTIYIHDISEVIQGE